MSAVAELQVSDFAAFYRALNHGREPFPWQERLARIVCEQGWPQTIDLPTGTGKTSCIDIALFAMALKMEGPRRIFYVVDRRVVVDQAHSHMQRCARLIGSAENGVLHRVALRLTSMSGYDDGEPVQVYEMRGGIYRDDSWVFSPTQPLLVSSTVDQVGSRLLFRGYGASPQTWPIHAALVANDALILLDEAHCSRPFAQTLSFVEEYRNHASEPLRLPFRVVEMTATPSRQSEEQPFRLGDEDASNEYLRQRLFASKPAKLVVSKARLKETGKYVEDFVRQALELARLPGLRRIAVMVNRIATAREVFQQIQTQGHNVHLLIGRMRPVDRERLHPDVEALRSGELRVQLDPVFVVATQCLEVGADLDFDALVTECASIDALLQRFGRLDRTGALNQAGFTPAARIIASAPMTDGKYDDAVYGPALASTWAWLSGLPEIDFGLRSVDDTTVPSRVRGLGAQEAARLRMPVTSAPLLMPAHLDALAQTSPRPAVEPDPTLFLHGLERGTPQVQVVWRADLPADNPDIWGDVAALCPPVAAEALTVPLWQFATWLQSRKSGEGVESDVEGGETPPEQERNSWRRKQDEPLVSPVLQWRGDQSKLIWHVSELRSGDTFILPQSFGGFTELGYIPGAESPDAPIDAAERARLRLKRGWILRLTPELITRWPERAEREQLVEVVTDSGAEARALWAALEAYRDGLGEPESSDALWLRQMLDQMPDSHRRAEAYPWAENTGGHTGWVLSARFVEADFGHDESSAAEELALDEHLLHVSSAAAAIAERAVSDRSARESVIRAAKYHDYGKADRRFQALLRGGDAFAAEFSPKKLAKGTQSRTGPRARRAQWRRSGLPDGFRHECVSLAMMQTDPDLAADDLALHLVASHHGRCRPFAPVVANLLETVEFGGLTVRPDSAVPPAHQIDSGVADRFWRLTRRYGWWGLAYLEALLRLGDWKASRDEMKGAKAQHA